MSSNVVRAFFVVGGVGFLLAALYMRNRSGDSAHELALAFGLVGFFWLVPQLVIIAAQRWKNR